MAEMTVPHLAPNSKLDYLALQVLMGQWLARLDTSGIHYEVADAEVGGDRLAGLLGLGDVATVDHPQPANEQILAGIAANVAIEIACILVNDPLGDPTEEILAAIASAKEEIAEERVRAARDRAIEARQAGAQK